MSTRVLRKMGLQDDRDLPPVKDDASDDTETSSGGVNKKRHLNMYDLVSTKAILEEERRRIIILLRFHCFTAQ